MRYLVAGPLLTLALTAQAFTLDEWRAWQHATPDFHSPVEHSRWLPETETRVHANGQLLYAADQSLLLEWLTPERRLTQFDIAGKFLDLTPSAAGDDVTPLAASDAGLPDNEQVGRLLLNALHGAHAWLGQNYHLLLSGDRKAWRLILLPREQDNDALKKISIEGGRFIGALQAIAPNGNVLTLELLDPNRLVNAEGAKRLQAVLAKKELPEEERAESEASTSADALVEANDNPPGDEENGGG